MENDGFYIKKNLILMNTIILSIINENFYSELYIKKLNSVRFSCWHCAVDKYKAIKLMSKN